jgi:type II secretory pathway component GspD/PulD (secretin)
MKKKICFGCMIIFPAFLLGTALILAQDFRMTSEKATVVSRELNGLEQVKSGQTQRDGKVESQKENITAIQPVPPQPPKIIIDTLELKDMDMLDVLKLLSQKSGLNIVAGKNINAKITIYLKGVDVRDVLRIILETNDLAYEEDGNIIKVITARDYETIYGNRFGDKSQVKIVRLQNATVADLIPLLTQLKSTNGKVLSDDKSNTVVLMETPAKIESMLSLIKKIDVPVQTKVFSLNYAKAEEVEKKLSEALTKNVGKIKVDKRSNKLYVTDTPTKMREISGIVSAFDVRHQEVLIEAKIVQVILSDEYKMGVDWDALLRRYHNLDLTSNFNVLSSTDKKGKFSIGSIESDDYTVVVEALNSVGTTNTLSSPRIAVINNEEARILVGSTEPYVTTTTTTPASGPTTTAESVSFIDVGVKLFVTPTINEESFITMKIRPEVSSVTDFLTTSQNNKIPIVETTTAETTVMVKDGVTIVIGGLIKDELIDSVNKVPFLGDLPLAGFVFRNKDKLTRKTELVVFLTPHIISGDYNSYEPTKLIKEEDFP